MKKIILAGGTGFLGSVLAKYFHAQLLDVVILSRNPKMYDPHARQIYWNGKDSGEWKKEFESAFAVINLTGRSVNCRYNQRNKKEILESRIHATKAIGAAIQHCTNPPQVWMNMSSATIYRHSMDRDMDEETGETGSDFSMNVCREWEEAFNQVKTPKTRKVILRTALALGDSGNSVLPMMKRLVWFGLGGKMGSGNQFISWIHEDDFAGSVDFILQHRELGGTFNVVAPGLITNKDFMKAIRRRLNMPFGMGATTLMLAIGAFLIGTETELVLKSRRAVPKKLLQAGFQFQFPHLDDALNDLIKK